MMWLNNQKKYLKTKNTGQCDNTTGAGDEVGKPDLKLLIDQ